MMPSLPGDPRPPRANSLWWRQYERTDEAQRERDKVAALHARAADLQPAPLGGDAELGALGDRLADVAAALTDHHQRPCLCALCAATRAWRLARVPDVDPDR